VLPLSVVVATGLVTGLVEVPTGNGNRSVPCPGSFGVTGVAVLRKKKNQARKAMIARRKSMKMVNFDFDMVFIGRRC
jgi:hypothetical protein